MTWYRAGGGGIPAALKTGMNSVLNKKFGTSTTYPAEDWPDTVNLMGPLPEKTASGAIVTFSDGADGVPLKKCEITLPASLDGYSEIDMVHCGKNLADFSSNTQDGEYHATVSYQNNGASVSASGTYSRCAWIIPTIIGQTYTVSYSGIRDNEYGRVMFNDSNTESGVMAYGVLLLTSTEANYTKTFTATSDYLYLIIYNTGNTSTGTSTISNLMMEAGSTASTFEPFSGTTATASLGRTIHGGTAKVVNGTGSEKYKLYTASDVTSLYWNGKKVEQVDTNHRASFRIALPSGYITVNNSICNELSYSTNIASGSGAYEGYQLIATAGIYFCIDLSDIGMENATSSTPDEDFLVAIRNYGDNLKFVVELATPENFTFTPITPTPETALGTNNFWADSGDSEVTYRADINLALGGQ